jgi:tRNA-dihydrouridine synthase B
MGVRIARKHMGWYLRGFPGDTAQRKRFNPLLHPQQQLDFVQQLTHSISTKDIAA